MSMMKRLIATLVLLIAVSEAHAEGTACAFGTDAKEKPDFTASATGPVTPATQTESKSIDTNPQKKN